ncbi:MAG TPA: hypothetical protein EYP30_09490 [Archaeoglobaceae archaeon]|nr:hypothetical protein [Archaeoglobaceae archaeon]
MSERDILLERLEKKLSQKEKEVEELRMMISFSEHKVAEIKKEIIEELRAELGSRKIKELEAKVVELSKTVESLTSDVVYLKEELSRKRAEEKAGERVEIVENVETGENLEEEEIITAEPCFESEKRENESEFIVCD